MKIDSKMRPIIERALASGWATIGCGDILEHEVSAMADAIMAIDIESPREATDAEHKPCWICGSKDIGRSPFTNRCADYWNCLNRVEYGTHCDAREVEKRQPITDEQVESVCIAFFADMGGPGWDGAPASTQAIWRKNMRAGLAAITPQSALPAQNERER